MLTEVSKRKKILIKGIGKNLSKLLYIVKNRRMREVNNYEKLLRKII